MKKILQLIAILLTISKLAISQSVTIDPKNTGTTPNIIDVKSSNQGIVVPRMTTAMKTAIPNKVEGIMVFDTDLKQFSYWNGNSWINVTSGGGGSSQWTTIGSNIYYDAGNVGINTSTPLAKLHVFGSLRYEPFGPSSPGVNKIMSSDANGNATWELPDYANTWVNDGSNNLYNKGLNGKVFIGNTTTNGDAAKLFLQTATNDIGLTHTDGTIKLSTIVGNINGSASQNGAWLGTRTNNPFMLMTNGIEGMKIQPSGAIQIGYNSSTNSTLNGHEWGMLDVYERKGGTANTLGIFGKTYGTSLQSNPSGIGFNVYNDPSSNNQTKIITTGNAARNTFDGNNGTLDWETFSYANGSDIYALNQQKIMSLSTAVAGVAGGGSQSESDRLTVFTNVPSYSVDSKYGFVHKQGSISVGTKITNLYNENHAQFGTQSNSNLGFFTNNNVFETMTIATNGNVGIDNLAPTAPLSFSVGSGKKISLYYNSATANTQAGLGNSLADLQLFSSSNGSGTISFGNFDNSTFTRNMTYFTNTGQLGIGTVNVGSYKLAVNGYILAKEIVVNTGWADFVFEKNYQLPTLHEVEKFIDVNKHLPSIPSANEIQTNGLSMGEMQTKMMQKIEELTLYIIELNKKIELLEKK